MNPYDYIDYAKFFWLTTIICFTSGYFIYKYRDKYNPFIDMFIFMFLTFIGIITSGILYEYHVNHNCLAH